MMRKREDTRERVFVVVWLRCNPDNCLRRTAGIRSSPWQASNFASLQSSAVCSTAHAESHGLPFAGAIERKSCIQRKWGCHIT